MGIVGCKKEGDFLIDDEDWPKSKSAQTKMLDEMMQDEIANNIDAGYGEPVKE